MTRTCLLLALLVASTLGSIFNPVLIIPNVTTFVLVFVLVATAEQVKGPGWGAPRDSDIPEIRPGNSNRVVST